MLELLACNCRRQHCSVGSCSCVDAGRKCTDACTLKDCENMSFIDYDDDTTMADVELYSDSDNNDDDDIVLFN